MSPKTIFILISAVILFALIFMFFTRDPKITNFPTSGNTIISFGDSLVEGVGTTAGNDYTSLLSARIGKPISNMGVSGNTTEDGLERVDEVLAQDPMIVLVLLGGNDTLKRVPVETTYANLNSIIKKITATGASVVLIGAPGGLYGGRYDAMYEELATTYGLAYVPNILKGLLTKPELMSDNIHPNDAGHIIMADRIEPLLRQVLTGARQ